LPDNSRTHLSFVERLKRRDESAWEYFEAFYGPIIFRFAVAQGLSDDLAEEVRSGCYVAVVNQIEQFDYDSQRGRFRNWLLTIASRRIADLSRKRLGHQAEAHVLNDLPAKERSITEAWEAQWREQIVREAFQRVSRRVSRDTREVLTRLVRDNEPVRAIAESLSITENQVYKAKQRCVGMLREEITILEQDPLTSG